MDFFRNIGLRTKVMFSFSLLIILPIFINTLTSYFQTVPVIENKASAYAQTVTNQISVTLDTYLNNVDRLSIQTAYSENVSTLLQKKYSQQASHEFGQDVATIYRYLFGMRKSIIGIDNIFVYNRDLQLFYSNDNGIINVSYDITQEKWFDKLTHSNGEKVLTGPYISTQADYSRGPVISLVRRILDITTHEHMGYIVLEINLNDIFIRNFEHISAHNDSDIYILNEDGSVIYNNTHPANLDSKFDSKLFEQISENKTGSLWADFDGKQSLVTYHTSRFTNWRVVNVTPKTELLREISMIRNNSLLLCVLLIAFAMILAILLSNSIVKPIKKLRSSISLIGEGDFSQNVEISTNDEIGQLTYSFNRMSQRLQEQVEQIYKNADEKRRIEIAALQTQISPHFTYNSLGVIKQMAVLHGADGITTMVDSLIDLLQAATKNTGEYITVKEELALIRAYSYIQEMRYCGKFKLNIQCEDKALNCCTLNLLLQPIIENAIFHGIACKNGANQINITVRIVNETLEYTVEDNGCGMTSELLEKVLNFENSSHDHIGIYNVNRRIKLTFGDQYGLCFTSELTVGTIVKIILPVIWYSENNDREREK